MTMSAGNPHASQWIDVTPRRLWRLQHARKTLRALARALNRDSRAPDQFEAVRRTSLDQVRKRSAITSVPLAFYVNVLCDLRAQGWTLRCTRRQVLALPPTNGRDAVDEKARVRAAHIIDRDAQLRQPAVHTFITEMERPRLYNGAWHSIFSVMRDGRELVAKLVCASECPLDAAERQAALRAAIDPYIQIAQAGVQCKFTGLDLLDIWRYFRHTWTTTYQSTPGRKIFILVRDRAAANHPVVGIAALGSPIVQLSVRDEWIGWSPKQLMATIVASPSKIWIEWLQNSLQTLLANIYIKDFIKEKRLTRDELRRPTQKRIDRLRQLALEERRIHQLYPEQRQHKSASRHRSVRWALQARTHLFRSKRASMLADLLQARHLLQAAGVGGRSVSRWTDSLHSDGMKRAVSTILRYTKAAHVGVEVMDITVCGAVAPYNHVLAGKLVSLLMASPEIRREYSRRYRSTPSIIASSMAGQAVRRKPRLVLLGTTSLYGVAPSQYNRLKLPVGGLDGGPTASIEFECLGRTAGFGSYHFSRATLESLEPLLGRLQRGRPVNSIFGEGVNPKLRKVRAALDAVGLPSNALLQHGSPRLVYGIALAKNFREILLGVHTRPVYFLRDGPNPSAHIVDFWRSRWLSARISNSDVLRSVEGHTLVHPIHHGARVPRLDENLPYGSTIKNADVEDAPHVDESVSATGLIDDSDCSARAILRLAAQAG